MPNKRNNARYRAGVLAALMTNDNSFLCFGAVENVSIGGAKLKLMKDIELPKNFVIILSSKDGPRRACSLMWQANENAGVRFEPIENEAEKPTQAAQSN